MSQTHRPRSPEALQAENAQYYQEILDSREASRIAARLVVEQFSKMEEVHQLLVEKAQVEEALRERIGQELIEAEQRERELADARSAADAANRAKSTFLANMSHELRTPLNAIIGYSELLVEEAADLGVESLKPDLAKINAAGRHLLSLINEFLDLSKIEAGKFELLMETFDVATALSEVVETVRPLVDKNGNRIQINCAADVGTITTDVVRLRQCLFNLLSNACKFTQGGQITLDALRVTEAGRDWLVFRVQDSGIGMTPAQLDSLYEPFTQVDASSTRKYGGTGLGLAITKKFCELMGGSIAVASEFGAGTAFTIRLPGAPAEATPPVEAAADPEPMPEAPAPGAATVLAIDDDPAVLEWMGRSLRGAGYHVITASNGRDGIELARRARPQVILLDVILPGMDGWEVLSRLKQDPELAPIPVVVVSVVEDRSMGFALGVAEFVTKPVDRRRLLAILARFAEGGRRSVLVVEDDPPTRETLRRTLEGAGWSVREAENGRVALQALDAGEPGLILLDLMMPEMDGFEFLERLRQDARHQHLPVVVVTAKELTRHEHERLNYRVQRVLHKGTYSRDELLNEVRRQIAKHVGDAGGAAARREPS